MGHPIAGGEGRAEFEFLNFLRSEDNLCVFIYPSSSTGFQLYCSHRLNWIQFISPLIWETHLEPHPKPAETMKIYF